MRMIWFATRGQRRQVKSSKYELVMAIDAPLGSTRVH